MKQRKQLYDWTAEELFPRMRRGLSYGAINDMPLWDVLQYKIYAQHYATGWLGRFVCDRGDS